MRPIPSGERAADRASAVDTAAAPRERRRAAVVFAWGLGVRLLGGSMIWAGDGHRGVFSKVVVCVGVVLSVGGIGVLKWLSMQPRRKRGPAVAPLPADVPAR